MNIADLHAFTIVAQTGSFSQTAERIHITQPAVSKRIAALEQTLETRLFDRIGHQIMLTEAGEKLLIHAKRILLEVEDSRRTIANLGGEVAGRLSIGVSHHIGLRRLPPALRAYTKKYPKVKLDLHFVASERACQAVRHSELEMALVTLPSMPLETLTQIPVWQDPLSFVTANDHPLCSQRDITPSQIARYPAILPTPGTYTRDLLERWLAPFSVALSVELETNYLETIKMMVSVGLGWSILPRTMLDDGLRAHTVSGFAMQRQLGIVHHQKRTLSNAASALIETLTTHQ